MENSRIEENKRRKRFIFFLSLFLILTIPCASLASNISRISLESLTPQKIVLTVGKSIILGAIDPVKRVAVGTPEGVPEIAVALVLTPRQIFLTGKNPGVTNLTIWGTNEKVSALYDIEVSPDIVRLKEMLQKILPEEKNIGVHATHDNITLSGNVSSGGNLSQVLAIAEPFFPKKVVNLLKVEEPSNIPEFKQTFQKMFPEEKDVIISTTPDNKITLSGSVSSKSNMSKALALGETYFPKRVVNMLNVESSPSQLKETLYRILPEEKDVKIAMAQDHVTLSGRVSSTSNLSQVLAISESFYPKKVINLLEVSGVHQVMLEVRVAEMSRSLIRRLGFNFSYISGSGSNFGLSLLGALTSLPGEGFPGNPLGVSTRANYLFRFSGQGGSTWTGVVDALKEDGLLKVLAEPTLITLSGKTANFLAGGEFPVPVPQASAGLNNIITIEYKPFGVGLNFSPTVLSSKKISMQVSPEVSELDFGNAIQFQGFVVPALTTRRASTTIELGDGQSFAIAGLLKEDVRTVVSKYPILGEIPILGALFRSTSFQKSETELIIIVTPHLVKPLDLAKQTLPTDQYVEPNDFEFYLLGLAEGKGEPKPSPLGSSPKKGASLEGNFGHMVPK
jgi:pilus assembly protein CpaC